MLFELYAIALLISENNTTLLLRRAPTQSFAPGLYSMVGGHVEENERALHAIRREVYEEVGLDLPESDFKLVHTFHRKAEEGALIAVVFSANISKLSPHNAEPHKHDGMGFFPLDNLPNNVIPGHKQAIECIKKNLTYSEHGWNK